MQVTIDIPDAVAEQIGANAPDLARGLLQSFALDGYRAGRLTGWQVQQLLGLESRWDVDKILKDAGIYREYTPEELEQDYRNSRMASDQIHGAP